MTLLDDLRARRQEARAAADEILTRAADEQRDLTPDELRAHTERATELREIEDRLEELRDAEIRELRAAATRQPNRQSVREPVLTRDQSVES